MFAPRLFTVGLFGWGLWLVVFCALFFFFLTLHRMLVVIFVSLALNPAKSIHDCSGTCQFEHFNRLASILPWRAVLAFKAHAFGKQVCTYVNTGLILHTLNSRAVDKVMLCGF